MPRFRIAAALLAAFILLGAALPLTAAADETKPITLEVKAGYDGQAKFGQWLPVSVDLTNNGPDVSGQLQANVWWGQGQPSSPVTEYLRTIDLPRGGKKQVTLFIPAATEKVTVTLLGEGRKTLAQTTEVLTPVQGVLAGVISDNKDAARFLSGINLGQANRPHPVSLVRIGVEEVPTVSAALAALDVLALSDTASTRMSEGQWRAVEAWVSQGGLLILGGGSQARQVLDAVPEALRPVDVTGTATVSGVSSLQSLLPAGSQSGPVPAGQYVVAAGSLKQGRVIAEENGLPLLVELQYGRGSVYYSAMDLGGEPLTTWAGSPGVWETLLRRAGLGFSNNPYAAKYGPGGPVPNQPGFGGRFATQLVYAVRNMPSLEIPSLRTLGLLLGGYALLAGPIIYLVLKRFDRRDWVWALVPAMAVVFAGSVYGVGFSGKGKDVFTNTLAVVRLAPGQKTVPVQSYVGVFAPSRSQFTIDIPGRSLVSTTTDNGYYGPSGGATTGAEGRPIGMRVAEGAGSRVELLDHNVWTVRTFQVDSDVTFESTLSGRLTSRPSASSSITAYDLEGKVSNGLPFDLEDVVLVIGTVYEKLGDIPAGGSRDVKFTTVVGTAANQGPPWYYQLYQTGSGPSGPDQGANRKQQMLSAAFENPWDPSAGSLPYAITVVGWTKERVADMGLGNREGRDHALTLFVAPVELAQVPGKISLPPGAVPARLVDADNIKGGPAGLGRYFLEDGSMVFQLEPNLPPTTTVSTLSVTLSANNNTPKVEFWNWKDNSWVEAGQVGIDRYGPKDGPERFIGPDRGTVRVRISGATSSRPFDFSAPSLLLEGEVKGQ